MSMTDKLHETFAVYARDGLIDNCTFNKLLKDAHILDGERLTTTDTDLIFATVKAKGQRKINFREFAEALGAVCEKTRENADVVASNRNNEREFLGPERFFYDKSTFTGVHRNGGPTTCGEVSRTPDLGAAAEQEDLPRPSGAPGGLERPKKLKDTNPLWGPERFFYDQKSYTGAHKVGGPSTDDRGKDGYVGNFHSLVNRGHVQNDSLQRRKFGGW